MNKKVLTILLITISAITGLFAYESPNVVLTADKAEVDYSFKVQQLNSSETNFKDLSEGDVENVILDAEGGTTNSYTIATIANGNMHDDITFKTAIKTGEFLDADDDSIGSGWYPVIEDRSTSYNNSATDERPETMEYFEGNAGEFSTASTATYTSTFTRGRHLFGTEIARFKLQYKADDELVAGSYLSTTTVTITTDK
jgi:hypothetical protein